MEFRDFLRMRRVAIGITQAEVANRLSERGHETSDTRVSHWERGRNKPPLDNPDFRVALALSLEMDVNEMMSALGFIETDDAHTNEARRAALIIDRLPPDARELALDYLEVLEKRFA